MKWIKLAKYCELSGDTADAFHARRRRRVWAESVHFKKAPDGSIWINTEQVEKWVEQQSTQDCHTESVSAS